MFSFAKFMKINSARKFRCLHNDLENESKLPVQCIFGLHTLNSCQMGFDLSVKKVKFRVMVIQGHPCKLRSRVRDG